VPYNASDPCTVLSYAENNCNLTAGNTNALVNIFILTIGYEGTLALSILLIINIFFAGNSSVTITSRITFALARDHALPLSDIFHQLNEATKSPFNAICLVWAMDIVLLLIGLGNTSAFYAIIGLTTIGFQISYAMPLIMRVTYSRNTFKQGAFHLGRFSYPIHCMSAVWLLFTSILLFWPQQFPVTAQNMNYACVVVGGFSFIATVYWFAYARHVFKGPKRVAPDVNHHHRAIADEKPSTSEKPAVTARTPNLQTPEADKSDEKSGSVESDEKSDEKSDGKSDEKSESDEGSDHNENASE